MGKGIKTELKNGVFSWVSYCLRSLGPLERCDRDLELLVSLTIIRNFKWKNMHLCRTAWCGRKCVMGNVHKLWSQGFHHQANIATHPKWLGNQSNHYPQPMWWPWFVLWPFWFWSGRSNPWLHHNTLAKAVGHGALSWSVQKYASQTIQKNPAIFG